MKRKILTYLVSFVSGMATGLALSFTTSIKFLNTNEQSPTNSTVVAISNSETNRATKTTYNVDWFKDNSNYIWDGWKIK